MVLWIPAKGERLQRLIFGCADGSIHIWVCVEDSVSTQPYFQLSLALISFMKYMFSYLGQVLGHQDFVMDLKYDDNLTELPVPEVALCRCGSLMKVT